MTRPEALAVLTATQETEAESLAIKAILDELEAQDARLAGLLAAAILVVQTLETVSASRLPAVQMLARLVGF